MSQTEPTRPRLLKGIVDELRVQAHLAAMNLKDAARPWLRKVDAAARAEVKQRRERKGVRP